MRYILVPPVPKGYAWWTVAEPNSDVMPNFDVATFSIHMPNAEQEARELLDRLNAL